MDSNNRIHNEWKDLGGQLDRNEKKYALKVSMSDKQVISTWRWLKKLFSWRTYR